MKRLNYKHIVRKAHRYMGVFIGIQFVLWTVGGLYFSWTDLDEIHGDPLRKPSQGLNVPHNAAAPSEAVEMLRQNREAKINKISIVEILGQTYYAVDHVSDGDRSTLLVALADGKSRPPINRDEAVKIAQDAMVQTSEMKELKYLTPENVSGHHEYREKPLPAWVATFENDVNVYLSAETGQTEAIRTTKWRLFDFLWMLHTMDFQGRDNINNYVLRTFSVLGLLTVLSGFTLFTVSSSAGRRRMSHKGRNSKENRSGNEALGRYSPLK